MDGYEAAIERPRANGHIVGLECVQKSWRFFNRRGEVGIREEHAPATCLEHAVPNAVALPAIQTVGNNPQTWNCLPKGFGHFRRAIIRTIIHDENFRIPSQTWQIRCDLF